MKHIEKIKISNARRFGENIEIEFGAGATIILAPNGTGKTTVFEAVELALTGNIKRLEKYPDAIIRDGCSEMKVRLDFSGEQYCYVNQPLGGHLVREGDYDKLFEVGDNSSISYLFRLTHFLEQRGKEWFVEQEEKVAGNLLSKLPLGKDLHTVISKKTPLIRAIGIAETNASNSLTETSDELIKLNELIVKRNKLVFDDKLQSLECIIDKLLLVGKLVSDEEYKEEYTLESVNSYFETIKVSCKQMDLKQKNLLIKLNSLNDRVKQYYSNAEVIEKKNLIIDETTNEIADINIKMEDFKNSFLEQEKTIGELEIEIKMLEADKSMFDRHDIKMKQLDSNISELKRLDNDKISCIKFLEEITKRVKVEERNRDQHRALNKRISKEKKFLHETENKKSLLTKWENTQTIILEMTEKVMHNLNNRKKECLRFKTDADNKVVSAEKLYVVSNKIVVSLNNTSSIIQESVSNIRRTLSDGQRKCPVCQSDFEPEELIKKIDSSLNTLNPDINNAIEEEKRAIDNLNKAKNEQEIQNQKLNNIDLEIDEKQSQLGSHRNVISEEIMPQFPDCQNIEEAKIYIDDATSKANMVISRLESEISELKPCIEEKNLDKLKLEKNELERTVIEISEKMTMLMEKIKNIKKDLFLLDKKLKSLNREAVVNELTIKGEAQISLKIKLSNLENELSKIMDKIRKKHDYLSKEKEAVSVIKARQDGISVEWTQAELLGKPDKQALDNKITKVSAKLYEIKNSFEQLEEAEKQLASWRVAKMYSDVDLEIKKIIGDINEEVYAKELKNSVEKKKDVLQTIRERKKAINLFLEKAVEESNKVNEQLESINEPWKRLLERIVINPLISKAPLLENTISYNKTKAKTSAIINRENIDISSIASEAQITDLQLTLMLAMANKYKWTAWNGLLLDDPTQHHDLVHASSVFDVLRDYIIDYDYQVMMSTHDSSQARFFQRKLENEGIPVKIYQLISQSEGVIAKRIS